MKFKQSTTSADLIHEFGESAMQLLDDIEERYEQGKKAGNEESHLAVRTRKQITSWFFDNGGL